MDPGALLITDLRASGMTIELVGDRLVIAPKSRITDQLRNRVRFRRQEAIDHLVLESRICAMADRWRYTADELAATLEDALQEPAAMRERLDHDERRYCPPRR